MNAVAIIPARMGSSRFPGKPLARLGDRSMLEHVYRRAKLSRALDDVLIATCDDEIRDEAADFGASVIMTSSKHERASDRIAEAAVQTAADIVVLVQGDEPMTHPRMIDVALEPMTKNPEIDCVNLTKRIEDEADFLNPNTIKVVMNEGWEALYMSRQPIPYISSRFKDIAAYKQVCIIPFRRDALFKYSMLEPTQLEVAESIDMMRFIENGVSVRMVETSFDTHAVDTKDDLVRVEKLMALDHITSLY